MQINRDNHRMITREVMDALKSIEARHGIKFTLGRGHYDNGASGDFQLKFNVLGENGIPELDENTKYAMRSHDLTDELVKWPGRPGAWRIVGYNSRAHRYPYTVKPDHGGQGFRISLFTAQQHFGKATRIPATASQVKAAVGQQPGAPVPSPIGNTPQRHYEAQF